MIISDDVKKYESLLLKLREELHMIPEESCEEFKTSKYIYDFLKTLSGVKTDRPVETGVRAVFDFGAEKTVGIRADIDGLPITEDTGLSFASRHKGVMHACGHDGHTAAALTFARMVSDGISGHKTNFVFLFQPAEETIGGAEPMIKAGVLESPHIDELYGIHFWPSVTKGKIAARRGAQMASMWDANIEITGKAAHGAQPAQGKDALLAAANFVMAANTIMQRNVSPFETAIYNIGRIEAGDARNIVAEKAVIEGTIRSFSDDTAQIIKNRVISVIEGIDAAYGTKSRYYTTMNYPALVNSGELFDKMTQRFEKDEWYSCEPFMMSEDFAFFAKEVPSLFAFVGVDSSPLHSPTFDLQKDDLLCAVEYYYRMTK